jgi:hypothetical protein
MKEEIFEASLDPEIQRKMADVQSTVKRESKAHVSFYDPLDETFAGKKKRLKTKQGLRQRPAISPATRRK